MKQSKLMLLFLLILVYLPKLAYADLFFNISSNTKAISIKTTVPDHTYFKAGIKITTPGFSLAKAGIECSQNSNGYCLFSVSDKVSKSLTISGQGKFSAILCLDGTIPATCQNYHDLSLVPVPPPPTSTSRLYIGMGGGFGFASTMSYSVCQLNQLGAITTCQDAGGGSDFANIPPEGIAFNKQGTVAFSVGNQSIPLLSTCPVNSSTGLFGTCDTNPLPFHLGSMTALALNSANTWLYFVTIDGEFLACEVNNSVVGACTPSSAPFGLSSFDIVVNAAGTKAYIAQQPIAAQSSNASPNAISNNVADCDLSGSTLSGCIPKTGSIAGGVNFQFPIGLALNKDGKILYVADLKANKIYSCATAANAGTKFDACVTALSVTNPIALVLNKDNTVAYVVDGNKFEYTCPVLSDSTFGNCTQKEFGDGPSVVGLS